MKEDRCIKCGSCMRACPVLNSGHGLLFPGPRTVGVDAPRFPERASIGRSALICSMCHACEWACPSRMELTRSMTRLRAELPPDARPSGHRRMKENVVAHGRTVSTDFSSWREEGNSTLYFPGCIGLGRLKGQTLAISSLLEALGVHHDISSQVLCCGSPLIRIGEVEAAEELRRRNMKVLSRYSRVITTCPGCTLQLREGYGVKAEHLVEVLREHDLRSNVEGRWALQVPCHLNRGLSPWTADSMAEMLIRTGVDLVRIPEETVCCGGGGGLTSGFPETAGGMASDKVSAYRSAKVKGVLTACPFCSLNLRRAGLEVLDIGEALMPRH